ncbi:MAG: hypothetical protein NVSMB7_06930 [Chitinophagaceae bacterium]
MQQVLNSQERNLAFLKFLLFFLVTIVLLIAAVFFNYRLPARELKMLQAEADIQRIQDVNQQKFFGLMQEAGQLIDSMDRKGISFDQVGMLANSKLQEMSKLQQGNNTVYGQIDIMIIDKLNALLQAKKLLQDATGNINKLSGVQADLDKCQQENLVLHGQLDGLRKSSGF